ncbi:MAG TPA: NADH-quinone oxidoreductase subunit M [Dermatophilaceae bacterium]|nr:NADH-quinone oxidoreductase subunit M [Dermatophilaceae bacterium]
MVLSLLVLVPLLLGTALVAAGRRLDVGAARLVAAGAAAVTAVLAVAAVVARPVLDVAWVPELGVGLHLGVDGISVPLLLLTAGVGVLVTAHAWFELPEGGAPATFLGCLLLVEGAALATFTARDAVLFFVAFELVLVPMWLLISRFGDGGDPAARSAAGLRFLLYTAVGSTLMLVGILVVVSAAGTTDLGALAAGAGAGLPVGTQTLAAVLLVAGLGVKVPVVPLHSWLPPAHTTAPTAGSVLLAAILLKMGTYGLVRLPVATVPEGVSRIAPFLAVLGALGVLWGGLVCLVERDLKRLIAYSSVAHMGFVVLGIASGTPTGLQAALFANVAHGVISALLFVLVGGLKARWGSVDLAVVRPALRETAPRLGFLLVLGVAAGLGLPGLAGFWGEFLALYAAWSPANTAQVGVLRAAAVAAALGAALSAAYLLCVARTVWLGDPSADPARRGVPSADPSAVDVVATPDTRGVEQGVLAALALAVVLLGVVPGPLLSVTSGAVTSLLGGGG